MTSTNHLVRVGAMGHIGRFVATGGAIYGRLADVIVHTPRGLEVGRVLDAASTPLDGAAADGEILRQMTVEDRLIAARLAERRDEAIAACSALLEKEGMPAVLVDVEHLFDGQSLYFYFLGDLPERIGPITSRLAEAYEAEVRVRPFTEALIEGCGPSCGTDAAEGGHCANCQSGCAIASASAGKVRPTS
ncbi:MAG: PSP1 C-terminal domain-containing protein [Pirellulales bacterium]